MDVRPVRSVEVSTVPAQQLVRHLKVVVPGASSGSVILLVIAVDVADLRRLPSCIRTGAERFVHCGTLVGRGHLAGCHGRDCHGDSLAASVWVSDGEIAS